MPGGHPARRARAVAAPTGLALTRLPLAGLALAGLALAGLVLTGPALTGCSSAATQAPAAPAASVPTTDPPSAAALVRVAQVFNDNYDNGNFGAVYDRWDARSQALISRAGYIRRHRVCAPATHAAAQVENATRGPHGSWLVSYRLDGVSLTDTWYYVGHRWVFDIIHSNPGAARQYRLPFARYAAAVGCTAH